MRDVIVRKAAPAEAPARLRCSVACDPPRRRGIVGTYVAGAAAGRGVGRARFAASARAARDAGPVWIGATIGEDNAKRLACRPAMSLRDRRMPQDLVSKRYTVEKA